MKELDPHQILLKPRKVADMLDVSRSRIYYWIATGQLEAVKLPGKTLRIRKSTVLSAQKDTLD